ncbi:AsmA family protein [Maridesulfovibrio sp. FT414]|uniref:AsmA family protein n=1 Tax=Maridesulfovibrio sp. FT414 TaxID=2979469 RepID=UPI003D807BC2
MGKGSKIIISVVAGLLVVVVAAMVLATILIDPNDYKDDISKLVREKTGRELVFDGKLELSVFPWIGVSTGGISFSNAPGFDGKNMFSLKSADVSVKLLPLLTGKVELKAVDVADLQLYLMRNKKGVTNWADLTGEEKKQEKTESSSGTGHSELNLSVAGVNIENAKIVWDDRMENVRQAVDDCDIKVDGFAPGSPFKFSVHVAASSTKPEVNADIDLAGEGIISGDFKQISVMGLNVVVDASGKAVPGGKGQVKVSADVALDMLKDTADVAGLVLEAYGVRAESSLKASGFTGKAPAFSGDLSIPAFNLKNSLEQMGMPMKTADSKALTSVGMNMTFAGTKSSAEIKNLLVNLDETVIKGLFSFANPDRPDIVAQLGVDKIDVDRYLPPKEEAKQEKKAEKAEEKTDGASGSKELIPVDLLRKLTLKVDLTVDQLVAAKAKISDVVVKVRSKDGVLTVKPASLNVAKGAFTSTAVVDASGKVPAMSMTASLSGLDGAVLAQDMTGKDSFSGKGDFNTSLKTVGNDMKTIYANLDGNLGFKFLDGYVSGFDILYMAGDAFSVLTGGAFGNRDSQRTEFGEVSATATIKKGVAVNRDLIMKSPLLRAEGAGTVDLNTMTIDYALDAKIVGTLEGQGGKSMQDLVGLTVPVTVKGDVADPSIMVDLPKFAAVLAKSGFKLVGSVIEGVGDVLEGIGNTITGKKQPKSGKTQDKNPVQELGNTIKKLF